MDNVDTGFLPLYRSFQDNELWKEKRVFSKAEAWIDILFSARYQDEDGIVVIGMDELVIKKGQCLHSMRTWGQRWGWGEAKVRRFLKLLQKRRMIELKNVTKTTQLTVCNYATYNTDRRKDDAQSTRNRRAIGVHTNKEIKKEDINAQAREGGFSVASLLKCFLDMVNVRYGYDCEKNNVFIQQCRASFKELQGRGISEDRIKAVIEYLKQMGDHFRPIDNCKKLVDDFAGLEEKAKGNLESIEIRRVHALDEKARAGEFDDVREENHARAKRLFQEEETRLQEKMEKYKEFNEL
jgi:hypothetical protein